MRIRFLLTNALGGGGTIATTIATASNLAARGHDVEIASVIRRNDGGGFPVDPRVAVVFLTDVRPGAPDRHNGDRRKPSADIPMDESRSHVFSRLTDRRIHDYLQRSDGIVIATRPALNLLLAKHGRPDTTRIGMEHINLAHHRRWSARFLVPQMKQWYPRLDALVALTTADAADYREFLPGTRIAAIPNAANTLDLRFTATTSEHVVVSAGRLTAQKGFDRLIAAFLRIRANFPDWQVHIFGQGPARDGLQSAIDRSDAADQIRMPGFSRSLPRTMSECGLLAMTSRYEGLPMVMLEAMGVGLPIVSYDFQSGPRDLVQHGHNGLLVPDGDEAGFATALAELMADPERRATMGRASRRIAEQFRPEVITNGWESFLTDFAEREPADTSAGQQSVGRQRGGVVSNPSARTIEASDRR